MSDEHESGFTGEYDAKAKIRAAVRYLLQSTAGSDRGDVVQQIFAVVNEEARGLSPGSSQSPVYDGMPGG
jgi:hypothetical protein